MCQGVVKGAGGTNLGINLEQISSLTEAEGIGLPLYLHRLLLVHPHNAAIQKVMMMMALFALSLNGANSASRSAKKEKLQNLTPKL